MSTDPAQEKFSTLVVHVAACQLVSLLEPTTPPANQTQEVWGTPLTVTVGAYTQTPSCGYTDDLTLSEATGGTLPVCIAVVPGTHDISIACDDLADVGTYQVAVTSSISPI